MRSFLQSADVILSIINVKQFCFCCQLVFVYFCKTLFSCTTGLYVLSVKNLKFLHVHFWNITLAYIIMKMESIMSDSCSEKPTFKWIVWMIWCWRLIKSDKVNYNGYFDMEYQKQDFNGLVCLRDDFNGIMTHF